MSGKRVLVLLVVLATVTAAAVGGWVAGSRIVSPAEAAARTAEPTPSPVLVPIEQRVLSSRIVTRGTARFGLPQSIAIVRSALKPDAALITKLPLRNTQFKEGEVILVASGRPLFVLQGQIPAYRDLVPDTSGDDVLQLEQALERMGYPPGPVDGRFDHQTSAAVESWYDASGWPPFGPTPAQLAQIRLLELELSAAENKKAAADDAAAAAPRAVDAARAEAEHASKMAAADVLRRIAERARVMINPQATLSERERANGEIEVARSAVVFTKQKGEVAIQAALDAQKLAEREAHLAQKATDRVAAELALVKQKTGMQVPIDEIVFLPSLPVRVDRVDAVVGDPASGPVLTVTNNQLSIDSSLRLNEAPLVRLGMDVVIDEQALGLKATGVVKRVDKTPGTHQVDGYHHYLEVHVNETSATLEGFSLRLTIPIESTGGVVDVVPLSALTLAADGTSRIQLEIGDKLEFIQVEPGLSADGFVHVTPVDAELKPGQLVVVGYKRE